MPSGAYHRSVTPKIRQHARLMRHNRTDAEAAMWRLLRDRRFSGFKFRRQVPFRNYILDFVCFGPRVVVEIDGSQHLDSHTDAVRDALLAQEGFHVARYWNNDVLQRAQSVSEHLFALLVREKG